MREPVTMMSLPVETGSPSAETDGVGWASTGPVGWEAAGSTVCVSCAHAGVASADAPTIKVVASRF